MRGAWSTSPSPPLSYPDYRDLRETNRSFTGILAYHHDWLALTGGTAIPERIYVSNVSVNYFDVLGIQPFMGRFLRPDEEATQSSIPFAILSYSLWQARFNADPEIVGKSIEMAQHPVTVIGVAPEGIYRLHARDPRRCLADAGPDGEFIADASARQYLAERDGAAASWRKPSQRYARTGRADAAPGGCLSQ